MLLTKKVFKIWLLIVFLISSVQMYLFATDTEKIIKEVQEKYQKSTSLEIQFKEINRFKLTNTTSEIFGTFVIKGKDQYRLNSETQIIVTDGETFWRYNKIENQVLIDNAKKENQEVLLNNFLYDLQKNYFSQIVDEFKEDGTKIFVLKLTPKPSNESFFTSIKFWVENKSWKIRRVIYTDYNENETEYEIEKIFFDKQFPDSFFTFNPIEGSEVVDVRY
jgi:outer membrane lipoprotein-sorting protein